MAVKIRLARRGRTKRPYYHIVVADARAPRDGKFIEQIGSYNPMTKPATIELDRDKAYDWLIKGAQPTDTARAILRFKGVMYRKHLQRGVVKGALTQEAADSKLAEWIEAKEAKIAARVEETRKEMEEFRKMVSGEAKPKAKVAADDDAAEAFREEPKTLAEEAEAKIEEAKATEDTPATEETPTAKEAPAAEETPAAEMTEAAEDAPATEAAEAVEEAPAAEMTEAAETAPAAEMSEATEDVSEAAPAEMTEAAEDVPTTDVAEAAEDVPSEEEPPAE